MHFDFCHHCGKSIAQDQAVGQTIVCRWCGQTIGVVKAPEKVMVDGTEELIRSGKAARCPQCQQAVEVRVKGDARSFVPHQTQGPPRRMCPNSGKPVAAAVRPAPAAKPTSPRPPTGKDLSAYMNRESIRVVACRRDAAPTIEELSLEYLDKADRVRIQIEAVRDILGPVFQMRAYPPNLQKPHLGIWGSAMICVIAKKHDLGGYQSMTDAELKAALADAQQRRALFFGH
jgi:hypothetical protein